ncbi:hypothetical protein DL766_007451 [Monosporascus sp. MC13-8B]|uniref:Xaa-Pro aminopeptidase n=1 Tax=Monosporascus cannonballus TaxID=155416 RepID=A0ABY0GUP8_9PEZI|nr:hypothetical protein DL762_010408 [Monosporascus cannonballus]RYO82058.1 hypothetical protein DL763_008390 [Monosporascus cannonballus]RYP23742.1 hypothetical protein DL766_007451 [Monosporascus sp. MC13-8B]
MVTMEATDVDHDLLIDDEFDALSIEIKAPKAKPMELPKKFPAMALLIVEETWEDSDQGPPFRQRRYFYYITGADFPGCSTTYDIAADKLTLWIPYTAPATALWFGSTPTPDDCLARCDVHDVQYATGLQAYLAARLACVRALFVLRASQLPRFDGFEQLKPRLRIDVGSLMPAMDEARLVKSDYEVTMIRKANEVSSAAHRAIARALSGYTNECQIEAAFCIARNAHAQAYPVIAGSGPNASTLHYESNNAPLAGRELVVVDAGAEWACYASDVTRTLPLGSGGKFSPRAQAIYDVVLRMQTECVARVRPGVAFRDLQLHATMVAVEGLLALGIFRRQFSADEIFRAGTGAAFFPHGLGHHVGLDVHDVLSRELLRPASEGMWGKRRPVGPQTVRSMIRQQQAAAAAAAAASTGTGTDNNNNNSGEEKPPQPQPQTPSPPPKKRPSSSSTTTSSRPASPSSPSSSSSSKYGVLQPGMVVTIEPGIYFCRPYIESYFLKEGGEHRRFFDLDALDRYWAVGGVRIEDCVLVTTDGCENLTSAPKVGVDE